MQLGPGNWRIERRVEPETGYEYLDLFVAVKKVITWALAQSLRGIYIRPQATLLFTQVSEKIFTPSPPPLPAAPSCLIRQGSAKL